MMYSKMSIQELIKSKVNKLPNGCWEWTGNRMNTGYGMIGIGENGRKRTPVHRYFYTTLVGPIQDGMHIDHICRNRPCVNPKHLRQLSLKDNVLVGEGFSAKNLRKTHCNNGHELSGKNLSIVKGKSGYQRRCKKCLQHWTMLKARQRQRFIKLTMKFVDDFMDIKNEWGSYVKSNCY